MSDETIITTIDGSKWRPATSEDKLQCHNCDNLVDTPERSCIIPRWELP